VRSRPACLTECVNEIYLPCLGMSNRKRRKAMISAGRSRTWMSRITRRTVARSGFLRFASLYALQCRHEIREADGAKAHFRTLS
jgi:hypothetical protein